MSECNNEYCSNNKSLQNYCDRCINEPSPIIDIGRATIDLREVFRVSEIASDGDYPIYFKTSNIPMIINITDMPREEFIKKWRATV